MSYETAIVVTAIILVATAVFLIATIAAKRLAAQNDELKQQASMRGWTFEFERRGGYRVRRWRGSTNGVAWMAESLERTGKDNRRSVRRSRWRTTSSRGPVAPLVCLGVAVGKETPALTIAQGEGVFAHLAQKVAGFALDQAIDSYFGEEIGREVDAASLKLVAGAAIPGMIVMAADADAAARLLFQGLTNALTAAAKDPQSALGADRRTWVLLWKDGVSLGRTQAFASTAEVETFARTGTAIAKLPIV